LKIAPSGHCFNIRIDLDQICSTNLTAPVGSGGLIQTAFSRPDVSDMLASIDLDFLAGHIARRV
jgi:hypothetical protein